MHVKGRKGDRRERAAPLASSFVQVCKCITLSLLPLVRSLALSSFARQEPVLVCLLPTASGLVFLQLKRMQGSGQRVTKRDTLCVLTLSSSVSRRRERMRCSRVCVLSRMCFRWLLCLCLRFRRRCCCVSLCMRTFVYACVSVAVCVYVRLPLRASERAKGKGKSGWQR